jgi:hypothetical protein
MDQLPINDEIGLVVAEFARNLSQTLQANGKGLSWRGETDSWLLMRLKQEVLELEHALEMRDDPDLWEKECLDVAAFAMFIWDEQIQRKGK